MPVLRCLVTTVVLALASCPAFSARPGIYRCELEGGHIRYQQSPCYYQDQPLILRDRRSGWSPLRPGERALLERYRADDAARRRKPAPRRKAQAKPSLACWKQRRKLEGLRAKLRRGYTLREDEALHRKRDNAEDYLRQFCP